MRGQKFIPLVVIAAGLLAYYNSFTGVFVFDDIQSIQENATIRHLWPIWRPLSPPHLGGATVEGRPLINLSLAVNYALGGYSVWGYHALNVTVHILAGLTLFGITRRTLRQPRLRERFGAAANELALAIAVLWTVHPLQTESVTYIIQRAESMMGLFYLLNLYCFIRGTDSTVGTRCSASVAELELGPTGSAALPSALWFTLSVVACALGMVSKEVMFSAPLLTLLYDRAFLSGTFREAWRRRWPLYLALASTWILLCLVMFSSQLPATLANAQRVGLSRWVYLRTQPGVILYYLRLSAWPYPLSLDHAWPVARTWISVLAPTVVVVMLLGATTWALRVNSIWGLAGAWFFLILAPSSSLMPLRSAIYEHRMYLSLAAVVSLVVMGLYLFMSRRSLAVFALMAITLGILTWQRNKDYRSEVTLWQEAVAKFPNGPSARYYLGVALWRAGRVQEAIAQYEQALQIQPDYPEVHNNLGIALGNMGAKQEAMAHYEQALRIKPDDSHAHYNMGLALAQTGQMTEAIRHYEQALRTDSDYAEAHYNLANALLQVNRFEDAIGHYREALRVKPDYADAHQNLGKTFIQAGRTQEAIAQYEQAAQLDPNLAEVHYNLGVVLEQAGKIHDAIEHYEQAVQLKPNYAEAQYNLGNALREVGKTAEARDRYERALRVRPDYAEAHYNLGVILWEGGQPETAIRHYEEALRLKPDYAEAHNNLGIIFVQLGRVSEAEKQFVQALRIQPDLAEAHCNLGVALERLGRAREAIGHYEQALRINPNSPAAQNGLARLKAGQ